MWYAPRVASTLVTMPPKRSLPSGRHRSFWYLNNDSDTVVVFVHGIFSDAVSCWSNTRSDVFWPDLVADDQRFGAPSIYLAGYYTAVDAGDYPIRECSEAVFQALQLSDAALREPPLVRPRIIFICHSTGGIVVRDLLVRHWDVFAEKEVGLLLFASPSLGSGWASLALALARFQNQKLGSQLAWEGAALEPLHYDFKDLVDQQRIRRLLGAEATENKFIVRGDLPRWLTMFLPNTWKVVDKLSAGQYFGAVRTLADTDHFSTVKPDSVDHPAHLFLAAFWKRMTDAWGTRVAAVPPAPADRLPADPPRLDDPALEVAAMIALALPTKTPHAIDVVRPYIARLFERRTFQLTQKDSIARLLFSVLATHRVIDDALLQRCDAPALREIQRVIADFEDALARVLEIDGPYLDDLRSKLPNKDVWLAERDDPVMTPALRSRKRQFLLRMREPLRALGCAQPVVPRLDASFIPDDDTGIVVRAEDDHYDLRIAIADRPPFVTKAKYDVRHDSFPPAWTISFDDDPDLADDEMRSMGDVAVKVTLYGDDGKAFVEFTTWLSHALAEHYGDAPPSDVREALRVLKSR